MVELNLRQRIYNPGLVKKIKESKELLEHKLILTIKNDGSHFNEKYLNLEIGSPSKIKMNSQGFLYYEDSVGRKAGISLEKFKKINNISLDNWREV